VDRAKVAAMATEKAAEEAAEIESAEQARRAER
jgi:hypothetical protein